MAVAFYYTQILPVKVILVSSFWKFNQCRLHCNVLVRPVGEDAEESVKVKQNIQKISIIILTQTGTTVDGPVIMTNAAVGYSTGRMVSLHNC